MITQLVRKQIKNMEEINWGDIPDNTGMRLLWAENPQDVKLYKDAIQDEIQKINLYPSPTKNTLKECLATYNNVPPEYIIPTNGSDEALELIAKVFITENDEVIIPTPSYPCFTSVNQMMGATIVSVALEKDFSLSLEKIIKAITPKTKIIWIANPNNPTGNILVIQKDIERLVRQINCLLVFDECYFEFSGVTAAQLTKKYDNIIVTRSFTKAFALGGARLGYIIANKAAATYLNRLQQSNQCFNVNRFAQAAGTAILKNEEVMRDCIISFEDLKRDFENMLKKLPALEVISTKTSFCFIKVNSKLTGKQLREKLVQKGIFIKDCSIYQDLGSQYICLGIPQKKYQKIIGETIKDILEG